MAEGRKHELLEHFLTRDDCRSAIVFTRTKQRAKLAALYAATAAQRLDWTLTIAGPLLAVGILFLCSGWAAPAAAPDSAR